MINPIRSRRERLLAERDVFRSARKLLVEDVTVLGEQLATLHLDTLTDELSADAQADYAAGLVHYDQAKTELDGADDLAGLSTVESLLDDGRFQIARVLARRDGRPLPERRDPCFFNPQHGPASRDLAWTPPAGVEREIAVCFGCVQRLEGGDEPEHRMVRRGDRWVPWYAGGGSFDRMAALDANVVTGSSWQSRVNQADAAARGAAGAAQFLGSG